MRVHACTGMEPPLPQWLPHETEKQSTHLAGPWRGMSGVTCGRHSTGPGAQHVGNKCQLSTSPPASPSGTEEATFPPSLHRRALGQAVWGSTRHLFGPRTDQPDHFYGSLLLTGLGDSRFYLALVPRSVSAEPSELAPRGSLQTECGRKGAFFTPLIPAQLCPEHLDAETGF